MSVRVVEEDGFKIITDIHSKKRRHIVSLNANKPIF